LTTSKVGQHLQGLTEGKSMIMKLGPGIALNIKLINPISYTLKGF